MTDPIRVNTGEPNQAQTVAAANAAKASVPLRFVQTLQRWFLHMPGNREPKLGKHSDGKKVTRLARDRQLEKRRTRRKMAAASRRVNR